MSRFDEIFKEANRLLNKDTPAIVQHIDLMDIIRLHAESPEFSKAEQKDFQPELSRALALIQNQHFEFGWVLKDGKITTGYKFGNKVPEAWQRALMLTFMTQVIVHSAVNPDLEELKADKRSVEFRRAQELFIQAIGRTVAKYSDLVTVSSQNKI